MPYFVLIVGLGLMVFMWVSYGWRREAAALSIERTESEYKEQRRRAEKSELRSAVVFRLFGTVLLILAMWFWGVEELFTQREKQAYEQEWIDNFVTEHRRNFEENCSDILQQIGSSSGIAYDAKTGAAVSVLSCKNSWSPPEKPAKYSGYDGDQPDHAAPYASQAIFGPDLDRWMCASPTYEDTCVSWDDLVEPPILGP